MGEAEAAAIQAKAEAEAQGMEKKAEAYQKYNDAAMASMVVDQLPAIVQGLGESLGSVGEIKIFGTGGNGGSGITGISGNLPVMLGQAMETIKAATNIDIPGLIAGKKANTQPDAPKGDSKPDSTVKKD